MQVLTSRDRMTNKALSQEIQRLVKVAYRAQQVQDYGQRIGPHASDILSVGRPFCLRKCVLAHAFYPNAVDLDAGLIAIYANGWHVHKRLQLVFQLSGVAVETEQQHIVEGSGVRFTPDQIIELPDDGRFVVEYKGYRREEFERLVKSPYPPEDAWVQAQLYTWLLGEEQCMVYIENKDNQQFLIRTGGVDSSVLAQPLTRLVELETATRAFMRDDTVLPPRICVEAACSTAASCTMREVCFTASLRESRLLPIVERFRGVRRE